MFKLDFSNWHEQLILIRKQAMADASVDLDEGYKKRRYIDVQAILPNMKALAEKTYTDSYNSYYDYNKQLADLQQSTNEALVSSRISTIETYLSRDMKALMAGFKDGRAKRKETTDKLCNALAQRYSLQWFYMTGWLAAKCLR